MTRQDAISRKLELEERREAILDQIATCDAASASISAGGGAKSYTNRTVAELQAKLRVVEREIRRLGAMLGTCASPFAIKRINANYTV